MNRLIFLLFVLCSNIGLCQADFQTKLGGFMLGQYRDCPSTQFGKPIISEKYDDGLEYEIFLLKPDSSLYMIFEYSPSDLNIIWSIQITGINHDLNFLNLSLGMNKSDLLNSFKVKPSLQEDIGEYGTKIVYDSANYSFEVNTNDQLSSIKIIDESYKYYTGPNKVERLPTFSQIQRILNSNKNLEIGSILAPDVEIYYNDSTYSFKKSLDMEINDDYSGVFDLIKSTASSISGINTGDTTAYEENIRLSLGKNPMHVIKFSNDFKLGEIVFKYQFDRYLIWEYSIKRK